MNGLRWCIYCDGDRDTGCEPDCPEFAKRTIDLREENQADDMRDMALEMEIDENG